jgi:ribosomal protein L44E
MRYKKTIGTPQQNSTYCKKGGDYREHGVPPTTGGDANRLRWQQTKTLAVQGQLDSVPEDIFCRFYGTLKRIQFDYRSTPKSLTVLDNQWHYGPTETGKSYSVRSQFPDHCIKPLNKWWDNYYGEKTVILDDVNKSHMSWLADLLKTWADHYPFNAEFKGGSMTIRPERIIVTSNIPLDKACEELECKSYQEPLLRRFRQICYTYDVNETPEN